MSGRAGVTEVFGAVEGERWVDLTGKLVVLGGRGGVNVVTGEGVFGVAAYSEAGRAMGEGWPGLPETSWWVQGRARVQRELDTAWSAREDEEGLGGESPSSG